MCVGYRLLEKRSESETGRAPSDAGRIGRIGLAELIIYRNKVQPDREVGAKQNIESSPRGKSTSRFNGWKV